MSTKLALAAFFSVDMVLDLVSFLVVVLVEVEASWPKLNMLTRPRTATIIMNFRVIFIRILSIAEIRGILRGPILYSPGAKNLPAKANPAGIELLRRWR